MQSSGFSVEASLIESYRFLNMNRARFLKLAGPLGLLWVVISILLNWWEATTGLTVPFGGTVVGLLQTSFAVMWFRFALEFVQPLGQRDVKLARPAPPFVRLALRSIGIVLGFSALLIVPTIAVATVIIIAKTWAGVSVSQAEMPALVMTSLSVAMLILSPVLCRFLPYYAAAAAGNYHFGLRASWVSTRGNSLRLWALMARIVAPWWLFSFMLEKLVAIWADAGSISLLSSIAVRSSLSGGLSFVAIALTAAGLAMAMSGLPHAARVKV